MIRLLKRVWRYIQSRLGWATCPVCKEWRRIRWVKDWIIHPEEPPMFCHYECTGCGARTEVMPTALTEHAVKKLGYKDFADWAKKHTEGRETEVRGEHGE